jgi:hypothetical protein
VDREESMDTVSISSMVRKGKWWNHQDRMATVYLLYGRRDFLVSFWHCVHKGNWIGVTGDEGDLDDDKGRDEGGEEAWSDLSDEVDWHKKDDRLTAAKSRGKSKVVEEGDSGLSCFMTDWSSMPTLNLFSSKMASIEKLVNFLLTTAMLMLPDKMPDHYWPKRGTSQYL